MNVTDTKTTDEPVEHIIAGLASTYNHNEGNAKRLEWLKAANERFKADGVQPNKITENDYYNFATTPITETLEEFTTIGGINVLMHNKPVLERFYAHTLLIAEMLEYYIDNNGAMFIDSIPTNEVDLMNAITPTQLVKTFIFGLKKRLRDDVVDDVLRIWVKCFIKEATRLGIKALEVPQKELPKVQGKSFRQIVEDDLRVTEKYLNTMREYPETSTILTHIQYAEVAQ